MSALRGSGAFLSTDPRLVPAQPFSAAERLFGQLAGARNTEALAGSLHCVHRGGQPTTELVRFRPLTYGHGLENDLKTHNQPPCWAEPAGISAAQPICGAKTMQNRENSKQQK